MIEQILTISAGIIIGALIIFITLYIARKIKPKRKPHTVSGMSVYDKSGKPMAWFQNSQDFDKYVSGMNAKLVGNTFENDYYYFQDNKK